MAGAELQLYRVLENNLCKVTRVEKGEIHALVDGREIKLSVAGDYRVQGPLLGDLSRVRLANFTVDRLVEPSRERLSETRIKIPHRDTVSPGKAGTPIHEWPSSQSKPSVIVYVSWNADDSNYAQVVPTVNPRGRRLQHADLLREGFVDQNPTVLELCFSNDGWAVKRDASIDPDYNEAFAALIQDDAEAFKRVVERNPGIPFLSVGDTTLIHVAASLGRTTALKAVDPEPAKVRALSVNPSPLYLAARNGHAGAIEIISKWKQRWVNFSNEVFDAPILAAVDGNHLKAAKALLQAGADPKNTGSPDSPFSRAVNEGLPELAALFEKSETGLSLRSSRFATIMPTQVRLKHHAMVEYLISRRVQMETGKEEPTLLQYAARENDARMVKILLRSGEEVNASKVIAPPLVLAAREGSLELIEALLDAGADPNIVYKGVTPLRSAVTNDNSIAVRRLLDAGARIEAQEGEIDLLELALFCQGSRSAEMLIQAGARLRGDHDKAKHWLVRSIVLDLPSLLDTIDPRFDWDGPLHGDWSAADIADACESSRCSEWLAKRGAKKNRSVRFAASKDLDGKLKVVEAVRPVDKRPDEARLNSVTINLEFIVDESGGVLFPRALSGSTPALRASCAEALAEWKFSAPTAGGQPAFTRAKMPLKIAGEYDGVVLAEEWDEPPQVLSRVAPIYPNNMKVFGEQGAATFEMVINTRGEVTHVRPLSLTNPALIQVCSEALKQWKFKPAKVDGKPAACRAVQTFQLTLRQ